jgi:hypothetical protein
MPKPTPDLLLFDYVARQKASESELVTKNQRFHFSMPLMIDSVANAVDADLALKRIPFCSENLQRVFFAHLGMCEDISS